MANNKLAKITSAMPVNPAPKEAQAMERRYRAEDALRTITRAEEIRRDRSLMAEVRKVAREQVRTLQNVASPKKR